MSSLTAATTGLVVESLVIEGLVIEGLGAGCHAGGKRQHRHARKNSLSHKFSPHC
jgi:hypothetical protein